MKTLYLDCGMGAAGDMLAAALLEVLPDPEKSLRLLNELRFPGVEYKTEKTVKNGITGTRFHVLVDGAEEGDPVPADGHRHADLEGIERFVMTLAVPAPVREDILAVFRLIAEAESRVHGRPVPEIHFHEVGSIDAIADITAVCLFLHELAPVQIIASPVHVGCGHVRCAHGLLPVPAPATAEILKGVPVYGGKVRGELCTPTGAALLKHFVSRFGEMPEISVEKIGYGMGKKDFEQTNCVRALLGQAETEGDRVCVLSCNVDDMSAEEIAFAMERLFAAGARDVYTIPLGMKKNRPGTLFCVICAASDSDRMAEEIFRHTSTIGIRRQTVERYTLSRSESVRQTEYGPVKVKRSQGYGVVREKLEYEDLARIARENGESILRLKKELEKGSEV